MKNKYKTSSRHVIILGAALLASTFMLSESRAEYDDERAEYDDEVELLEPGLHGTLTLGFANSRRTPALNEGSHADVVTGSHDGTSQTITSLDTKAPTINETFPVLDAGELQYVLENGRTAFSISFNKLGVSHVFNSGMSLALDIGIQAGSSDKVFADPFLTNAARQEIETNEQNFSISAERLFGLPILASYDYLDVKVPTDTAGLSLVGAGGTYGITAADMSLLRRSGKTHTFNFATVVPLSDAWALGPSIGYHTTDADGKANSAKGFDVALGADYIFDRYQLIFGAAYSQSKFEASHPVFKKTRDDKTLSYQVALGIAEPFGHRDTEIVVRLARSETDSNITFYDSTTTTAGVVWAYFF